MINVAFFLALLYHPSAAKLGEICFSMSGVTFEDGYDPNVPPVIPVNDTRSDWGFHPLEMSTSNYIPEITEVDDVKRTISMPVVSVKEWKDPRIKVTLKYNNTRKLISEAFFQQCVWSPNLVYVFLERVEAWSLVKKPIVYSIGAGGALRIISYNQITLGCVMKFDWFPFDRQVCFALESSLSHGTQYLKIIGSFDYEVKIQRELQYHVNVVKANRSELNTLNLFNQDVSYFGWEIQLKRRLGPYVMQTYLPTSVLVCASWIGFLIPPEVVPGRMALLVTLLLVLVNIFLQVANETPRSSTISAISAWNIICILMVVSAIIQYGVILFINLRDGMKDNRIGSTTSAFINMRLVKSKKSKSQLLVQKIDQWSFFLFPIVSMLLAIIYWSQCMSWYTRASSQDDLLPRGFGLDFNREL